MIADLDWSKPEPGTPLRIVHARKPKVARQRAAPLRTCHIRRLAVTRKCVVCVKQFHPWFGKPGLTCSRRCANLLRLSLRTPSQLGYLFTSKELQQEGGDANDASPIGPSAPPSCCGSDVEVRP